MEKQEIKKLSDKSQVMICKLVWDDTRTKTRRTSNGGYYVDIDHLNEIVKVLGISTKHVLDANYITACLNLNEQNLSENKLNISNFKKPELEKYKIQYVRVYDTSFDDIYNYDLELYTFEKRHIREMVESDYYYDSESWHSKDPDRTNYSFESQCVNSYIEKE